jgi:hypothetical protein
MRGRRRSDDDEWTTEKLIRVARSLCGPRLRAYMDLLSPPAPSRILGIPGFDARDPIRLFCARIFLCPNFRCLLLPRGLPCKLEMSALRSVFFQSSILAKSVRRSLFPLRAAKVVRLGNGRRRLPAEISGGVENSRSPGSLMMLPRPIKKTVMARPFTVRTTMTPSNRINQVRCVM